MDVDLDRFFKGYGRKTDVLIKQVKILIALWNRFDWVSDNSVSGLWIC